MGNSGGKGGDVLPYGLSFSIALYHTYLGPNETTISLGGGDFYWLKPLWSKPSCRCCRLLQKIR